MLHNFKLLCSMISELITLLHNQKTAITNFTNNYSIFATSTESTINYQENNSPSLLRQSISLSPHYTLLYSHSTSSKKSRRLIYKSKKTIQKTLERNHVKKEKSISSYVIGYRNSSKKLESLDQSRTLLCRNNDCDMIKAHLQQNPIARKKGPFFQSVAEQTK